MSSASGAGTSPTSHLKGLRKQATKGGRSGKSRGKAPAAAPSFHLDPDSAPGRALPPPPSPTLSSAVLAPYLSENRFPSSGTFPTRDEVSGWSQKQCSKFFSELIANGYIGRELNNLPDKVRSTQAKGTGSRDYIKDILAEETIARNDYIASVRHMRGLKEREAASNLAADLDASEEEMEYGSDDQAGDDEDEG
jgi:hypothetical protein